MRFYLRSAAVLLASAAASSFGLATPAQAYVPYASPDLGNEWDPVQADATGRCGPTGMEFDFAGDVTQQIPPPYTEDYVINPFYAMSQTPSQQGIATYNPVTVTFDSGANLTRVIMSGSALPLQIPPDFIGPNFYNGSTGTYHTGLNLGPTIFHFGDLGIVTAVSRHWLWDCGGAPSSGELPWLSVHAHQTISKRVKPGELAYAGVYIQTADNMAGKWSLSAYKKPTKGSKVTLDVTNASSQPVSVGLLGVQLDLPVSQTEDCIKDPGCKENEALLDRLDDANDPLPGMDGSTYVTIKPPKKPMQPGATFQIHLK